MRSPMGTQSTAKTVFLLISMGGWAIVGAALMYLFPAAADQFLGTAQTHLWMENLARGGYQPSLGITVGAIAFILTVGLNVAWYRFWDDTAQRQTSE